MNNRRPSPPTPSESPSTSASYRRRRSSSTYSDATTRPPPPSHSISDTFPSSSKLSHLSVASLSSAPTSTKQTPLPSIRALDSYLTLPASSAQHLSIRRDSDRNREHDVDQSGRESRSVASTRVPSPPPPPQLPAPPAAAPTSSLPTSSAFTYSPPFSPSSHPPRPHSHHSSIRHSPRAHPYSLPSHPHPSHATRSPPVVPHHSPHISPRISPHSSTGGRNLLGVSGSGSIHGHRHPSQSGLPSSTSSVLGLISSVPASTATIAIPPHGQSNTAGDFYRPGTSGFGTASMITGSDGDETERIEQPSKKKRRRQALSCTECKRRKIRCDRNQPCLPCTKRGEQAKCQWHIVEPVDKYVSRAEYDDLRARVDKLEALVVRLRGDDPSHRQGIGGSVGTTTTTIAPIYGPPGHGGHGHGRADYDVQPGRMLLGSNTEPSGMVAVKEEHSDDGSARRSVSGGRSRSPGSTGMGGGGGRRGSESFGVPSSDSEDRLGPLVSSSRGRDRESMGHSRSSSGGTSITSGVETGNITGPGKGGVTGGRLGRGGDGGGAKEYHHDHL